jgi:hypothetical protein
MSLSMACNLASSELILHSHLMLAVLVVGSIVFVVTSDKKFIS